MPPSAYFASKSYQSDARVTIAPGSEVSTLSWSPIPGLPITEHSTSRPPASASTITRGSWASATSTARSSSCSGLETREMPTLEPSRDGFTQSGFGIAATCSRQPWSPTSANSTWGSPWKASSRLQISLSIATAAASTLGPA